MRPPPLGIERLGCDDCHAGDHLTDSAIDVRHDVGTITARSGQRRGAPLDGLDTPGLRGIWGTAPYLHDGSAATLVDVLVERNPDGAHGAVGGLDRDALSALLAYLRELE